MEQNQHLPFGADFIPTHLKCVHCKQLSHATDLFSSSLMVSVHVTQYHTTSLVTSLTTDMTFTHASAEKYFRRHNSDTLSSVAADVPVLRITLSDEMGVPSLMLRSAVSAFTNQDSITVDRSINLLRDAIRANIGTFKQPFYIKETFNGSIISC